MFGSKGIIFDAIKELADISAQERMWVKQTGDEISSFAECVSALYNDTSLQLDLQNGRIVFGKEIDEALCKLKKSLDKVDQAIDPAKLVSSAEMQAVRNEASIIKDMMIGIQKRRRQ